MCLKAITSDILRRIGWLYQKCYYVNNLSDLFMFAFFHLKLNQQKKVEYQDW